MHRSARPAGMQVYLGNEANEEPKADKGRSKDKITKIAIDNGTMIEAFKYLNYCQVANNSFVSKRFRNLIQTHRHSLAFLYVDAIGMFWSIPSATIKVFDKELSPEAYDEWVICNGYSKQAPLEDQVASTQSKQNIFNGYGLYAYAHYKDPSHRESNETTTVFLARVKFNHENWPLFEHFIRLVTDPFICIDNMELTYESAVLSLLAGAINSADDLLQCKKLELNLSGNVQKSITWTKDHARCNKFYVYGEGGLNQDEAFLDFFVTGGHCTPSFKIGFRDLYKVVIDFVQKFMDLKNSDEILFVEAIEGNFEGHVAELFKDNYADFIVKEDRGQRSNTLIFEFVNNNIGKKLQLSVKNHNTLDFMSCFLTKINNL